MMTNRAKGFSQLIGQIISPLIYEALDIEFFGLPTVTNIKVSSDFSYADVFISTMENKDKIEQELRKHAFNIQKELNQKLQKKRVPRLRFKADYTPEQTERFNHLMNS